MAYDPRKHHRRSIRLRGHDYAGGGAYSVTICVNGKERLFGEIVEGEMALSRAGEIVQEAWKALAERFPSVVWDAFQMMPNHVHAIIVIPGPGLDPALARATGAPIVQPAGILAADVGPGLAPAGRRYKAPPEADASVGPTRPGRSQYTRPARWRPAQAPALHLGRIVGAFKSMAAIQVNHFLDRVGQPLWQEDYFEHIVRDVQELESIRDYVIHNPQRWLEDPDY